MASKFPIFVFDSYPNAASDEDFLQLKRNGTLLGGLDYTGAPYGNLVSGGGGGSVTSVFGRTGTVVATVNDYNFNQLAGSLAISQINASGTPSSSTFLRGDGSWAAGTGGVSSPVSSPTPFIFNTDLQMEGPNPWLDVRSYGVRAVLPNSTPAAVGLTANTTATNPVVSISAASSFVNGDGVVIYGAGASHSMSTPSAPTVTPSIGKGMCGSGYTVAGPTGSTSYQYQIIARNTAGGMTAASTAGTTTTGASSLGAQSVAITSLSRSNATVTVTTSSAHGLAVGAMVLIEGTSSSSGFDGWFNVATVPDTSHFTYTCGLDTRNGALTSGTGGNAYWFNCNAITLPTPGTGVWQFYIYGRVSGSMTLLGVSQTVNSGLSSDPTYMIWEDYGSTMSGNVSLPAFVPSTPPGSATANHLVTTISSGAGTTSLTLAAAPSQNLTGATIRFDNTPNIQSAFNAATANAGSQIYFPVPLTFGQSYVVNSFCDLSSYGIRSVLQNGSITLNDTMKLPSAITWQGGENQLTEPQFGIAAHVGVSVVTANPGFLMTTGSVSGINFTPTGNCYNSVFITGNIPTGTWEDCSFAGGGSSDYMGVNFYAWCQFSAGGAAGLYFRNVLFSSGPTQVDGSTGAPQLITKSMGEISFDGCMMNRRGFLFVPNAAGQLVDFNQRYEMQGGIMPMLSFYFAGGGASGWLRIAQPIMDTSPHPVLCHLGGGFIPEIVDISGALPGTMGCISGYGFNNVQIHGSTSYAALGQNVNILSSNYYPMGDGIFSSGGNGSNQGLLKVQKHLSLGSSNSFFTDAAQPAAPTATVATAGPPYSKAVTNGTYTYCAVYANGGVGPQSAASNAVTTDGATQQATVIISTAVPGAVKYFYYGNGILMGISTSLSFVAPNIYVGAGTLQPGGGPAGIQGSNMWTQTLQIGSTVFASLGSPANGTLVFCGDCTAASSPCTGSGSGTFAFRRNGAWACL
jgi:hypothetical protein